MDTPGIMGFRKFKDISSNKIGSELRDLRQRLTFTVLQEVLQLLGIEFNGFRG